MTAPSQAAQALRAVADEIEQANDPHELLRLAALAHWRLNEAINLINDPEPNEPYDSEP